MSTPEYDHLGVNRKLFSLSDPLGFACSKRSIKKRQCKWFWMILTLTQVFPKMCSPVFSCSFDRCKGFCIVDRMIHYDWLRQGVNRAAKQGSDVQLSKWQTGYRVIEEVYVLACMWWAWGDKRRGGGKERITCIHTSFFFFIALLPQCKKKNIISII